MSDIIFIWESIQDYLKTKRVKEDLFPGYVRECAMFSLKKKKLIFLLGFNTTATF